MRTRDGTVIRVRLSTAPVGAVLSAFSGLTFVYTTGNAPGVTVADA
jgi:hypothetical protein